MTDLYNILNIDKNADQDTIRKAYKKLAPQFHPDKNKEPDAEEKFKQINHAYTILSDPEKKEKYDRFGIENDNQAPQSGGFPGGFPFADLFSNFGFGGNPFGGSPFEVNIGGMHGRSNNVRVTKEDINVKVQLTYEEIYIGCKKTIKIDYKKKCNKCNGSGGVKNKCDTCNGHGRIRTMRQMGPIVLQQEGECNRCNGSGKIVVTKCDICNGNEFINSSKDMIIDIPAGIKANHIIIKENQGHEVDNVKSDLKVHIEELPHTLYKRDGNDLKCRMNISLIEALSGYNKELQLLDGTKTRLTSSEVTQPNTKLNINGGGFPDIENKGNRGKIICSLDIVFPDKLTGEWVEQLINSMNK